MAWFVKHPHMFGQPLTIGACPTQVGPDGRVVGDLTEEAEDQCQAMPTVFVRREEASLPQEGAEPASREPPPSSESECAPEGKAVVPDILEALADVLQVPAEPLPEKKKATVVVVNKSKK